MQGVVKYRRIGLGRGEIAHNAAAMDHGKLREVDAAEGIVAARSRLTRPRAGDDLVPEYDHHTALSVRGKAKGIQKVVPPVGGGL